MFFVFVFSYRFTQIAVDPQVKTPGGKAYDVLFIGTGKYTSCTKQQHVSGFSGTTKSNTGFGGTSHVCTVKEHFLLLRQVSYCNLTNVCHLRGQEMISYEDMHIRRACSIIWTVNHREILHIQKISTRASYEELIRHTVNSV